MKAGRKSMYDEEIALLRELMKAYEDWPHNPECVSVADKLRSAISALERLAEIEMRAAESR